MSDVITPSMQQTEIEYATHMMITLLFVVAYTFIAYVTVTKLSGICMGGVRTFEERQHLQKMERIREANNGGKDATKLDHLL